MCQRFGFFFSSRRRHTSSLRDWSSDVCSSDLLGRTVEHTADSITVDGTPMAVLAERDPAKIDWGKLGADVVVESTGKFRTRDGAALHLKGGARKVLISAPGKGVDVTIVLGVNDGEYDPQRHDVISNASCTTNCVAPM